MDELEQNNYAELCGTLAAPPVLSHENRQERFFTFPPRGGGRPGSLE